MNQSNLTKRNEAGQTERFSAQAEQFFSSNLNGREKNSGHNKLHATSGLLPLDLLCIALVTLILLLS